MMLPNMRAGSGRSLLSNISPLIYLVVVLYSLTDTININGLLELENS